MRRFFAHSTSVARSPAGRNLYGAGSRFAICLSASAFEGRIRPTLPGAKCRSCRSAAEWNVDARTPLTPSAATAEGRLAALEAAHQLALREIQELKGRDALKTQFLANISHDLRTPLTAIITHAEILREGILGELSTRQHESIAGIIGGGRRLLDMVGEILTYARGAANQLTFSPAEVRIGEVIEQVRRLNESLVARKELCLEIQVAPEVSRHTMNSRAQKSPKTRPAPVSVAVPSAATWPP